MAGWLHLTGPPASSCSILRTGEKDLIPCSLADYLICLNKNLVEKNTKWFHIIAKSSKNIVQQIACFVTEIRDVHPPKSMMHIVYSPYFGKIYKFPNIYFGRIYKFSSYFRSISDFLPEFTLFCFPLSWLWCIDALYILDAPVRDIASCWHFKWRQCTNSEWKKILLFVTFKYCFCLPPKPLGVDSGLDIDMPFVVRPGNP